MSVGIEGLFYNFENTSYRWLRCGHAVIFRDFNKRTGCVSAGK